MQEDITHLKGDMAIVKQGVEDLKQTVSDGFADLSMRNSAELVKLAQEIDKKYASKWVERVLWGGGAIIGAVILVAIVELVIKK